MAMGVAGSFELSGTQGMTLEVSYSETYDVSGNKSDVSITQLRLKSSDWLGITYYLDGTIAIAGSTAVSMDSGAGYHGVTLPGSTNVYATAWGTLGGVSGIIHNDADGSKTVTISVNVRGYIRGGGTSSGWSVSGSKTIKLTTIPRASTIGATDANIGAVSMIAVSRKSAAYTHSIYYQFGNLSGYITAAGGTSAEEVKIDATSVAFLIPESFYAQIPAAKSGVCTLTCKTYSGTTQIGSAQTARFTVTAAETVSAPIVSGMVIDTNPVTLALTGDEDVLVRFYSTALATISSQAQNGASIVAETVNGQSVAEGQASFPEVEQSAFTFAAQDSRGYSGSAVVTKNMVPYVRLTCNPTGQRTDPTSGNAVLTIKGNYYNGSFGAVDNALQITYAVDRGDPVAVEPSFVEDTYSAVVALSGLDYNTAHTIEITVADKLDSLEKKAKVEKGIPIFDWGEHDFYFNVPVYFVPEQYAESTEHRGCYYRVVGTETEWFNPPMELDTEYRTTERWQGRVVYTMAVDAGAMPNATVKRVSFTIPSGTVDRFLNVTGSTSQGDALPYVTTTAGYRLAVARGAEQHEIIITTDADKSAYTAVAVVKYIKVVENYTGAVLGKAILGRMILGRSS